MNKNALLRHVRSADPEDVNLDGRELTTLPPEIGQFTRIRTLRLRKTGLSSPLNTTD
ncbi:MAG: hypothetical protein HQ567_16675 [Candidatus Nealsonbacteria bacterium]|nr:hypothetical protein [Candidatus Nealsonbacteria bacterium]